MGPAGTTTRAAAASANHVSVSNGHPPPPTSSSAPMPEPAPPDPPPLEHALPSEPPPTQPTSVAPHPVAPMRSTSRSTPAPQPPSAPIAIPCYSTFALNSAQQREFPVDETTGAGIILLRCSAMDRPATALWDTGAEGNFASWNFIERHGLQAHMQPSKQRVKYADGSISEA